ncbi:TPA: hypothetical protein JD264_05905 [Serratia fonticola]|nr:hypothetical protein [Serratia fonticola]
MGTIIFIDDDNDVRDTYELSMSLMFADDFNILCLNTEPTIDAMLEVLSRVNDKVTYFVDEKLKHSGVATYSGVELVQRIRMHDSKIPIYILTSFSDEIEQYFGDVEFVIDKNDWESEGEEDNLKKRFLRHINTYKDIKSKQAERFDFLLEKSLFSTLDDDEIIEFKALDIARVKDIPSEGIISTSSLEELKAASEELNFIYNQLKNDKNE